jgi:hypothetical protein
MTLRTIPIRFAKTILLTGGLMLFNYIDASAQQQIAGLEHLFTPPLNYVVTQTNEVIKADGNLTEKAWEQAKWSTDFVDIEGSKKPLPNFKTQVKMLWNDSTLFIAAQLEEPQVWATLKNHDDIIYHDNDFEVFIDPYNTTHHYFEIEVNAFNKIFDLFMNKPYRNGGDALLSWNIDSLKSGIKVQGTLNNPKDKDKGWTVEMAIPLKSIAFGMGSPVAKDGSLWRINFSRVQYKTHLEDNKIVKDKAKNGKDLPENNWVWSPQGVVNMHFPERWGYLLFSTHSGTAFTLPVQEKQRQWLWLVYYREKEYFNKNHRYTNELADLNIPEKPVGKDGVKGFAIVYTPQTFLASVNTDGGEKITINEEGLITTPSPM